MPFSRGRHRETQNDLAAIASTSGARRLRILIVDDNPGDSELVSERLGEARDATFDIHCASDLRSAVEALQEGGVDAIVLDLNLPDSRGVGTLIRIRAVSPTVPTVVVSGHVDRKLRSAVLDAGAEEVFSKDEANSALFSRAILGVVERYRARVDQIETKRVLSALPEAILIVGHDGEVKYVNDGALELFGRSREDFVGELLGFSVQDDSTSDVTILARGEQRLCQMRVARVEWNKEPAFVASLRDETDKRKLETQLAMSDRLVSIGTLAAGVAHEINNPLASMMLNLDVAVHELTSHSRSFSIPHEILDELKDAKQAADRVRHIVRDLKTFSRPEDDELGPVDVHRVIESTLRMACNEIRHRARLVKTFGHPPLVRANDGRLGQVFLNLMVNAAQAIPTGDSESNEIRITTGVDAMGRATISIADTGVGMSPAVQDRIFSAFFTTKPMGVGTGLGLAISQRIVTSFDGHLSFESVEGEGTCFTLTLPAADSAETLAPKEPARNAGGGPRRRVLVIDDEAMIGQAVKRILRREHDVWVTTSAERALEMLRSDPDFDVLLCDVMMPQVSGVEFYERLRRERPGYEDRVVFMTGGAFINSARAFLDEVPNRRLEKPFDVQGLRDLVQAFGPH